jgi:hypothetical protein
MKDIIVLVLVAIIFVILAMRVVSGFAPGAAPAAQDVKTMLASGMPEVNVIVSLIKSGVPSDQAEQLVMQAKHA